MLNHTLVHSPCVCLDRDDGVQVVGMRGGEVVPRPRGLYADYETSVQV